MNDGLRVGGAIPDSDCDAEGAGLNDAEARALGGVVADWCWRTDADGRFAWISPTARTRLPTGWGDPIGRSRLELLRAGGNGQEALALHAADIAARRPFRDFAYQFECAGAGVRWVSSTGTPRFDPTGIFLGYVGAERDVTAMFANFAKIGDPRPVASGANATLRNVFEALSVGLMVFGPDRRLLLCNRRMAEFYPQVAASFEAGVSLRAVVEAAHEVLQRTRGQTDAGLRSRRVARQLRNLETPRTECTRRLPDGRWIQIITRRLDDGTLVGLFIEITRLKRREADAASALDRAKIAEEMINGVNDAIFVKDDQGRYVLANRAFTRLIGRGPEEAIGVTDFDLVDKEHARRYDAIDRAVLATGSSYELEEEVTRPDGSTGTHILRKTRISVPSGASYVACMLVDISAQKRQAAHLADARDTLQKLLNEVNNYKFALDRTALVAFCDLDGRLIYVNDRFCQLTGFDREELVGRRHLVTDTDFHGVAFIEGIRQKILKGEVWSGEFRNRKKDGTAWWADTTVVPLQGPSGEVSQVAVLRYDITDRKAAEERMRQAQNERAAATAILRDVIDTIPDAIVAFDEDDRLVFHNRAYKELYRISAPAIRKGARFENILRYGLGRGQYTQAGRTPEEREAWLQERLRAHRRKSHDGIQKIDHGRWVQLRDRRSQSGHLVSVRSDITAQRHAEAEIRRYAETDDLTGADNRKAFYARMDTLLSRDAKGRTHVLAMFDLDRFKEINDALGHDAGDEYICEIVRRLKSATKKRDIIARLGGDEFAIVLVGLASMEQAESRIAALRETFGRPITLRGEIFKPSASVGVALFPYDGSGLADLMKAADTALYEAKSGGRDRCAFYEQRLGEERRSRQETALRLVSAISRNEIAIALQPQVDLETGRLAGFEALARWRHPDGVIMPGAFIDVATEHGLIVPLGHAVLDQSVAAVRRMLDAGIDPVQVAVNVAGPQLKLEGFAERVAGILSRHDVEPSRLEIEITEEVLFDRSPELINRALDELRECGVTLALDDFGTGYASLTHLKQFKVQRLKIDRSFIHDIGKDRQNTAISLAILDLASSFDMQVVAEGIETLEQLEFLRSHGCKIGQGFLFGKPDWPDTFLDEHDWSKFTAVA